MDILERLNRVWKEYIYYLFLYLLVKNDKPTIAKKTCDYDEQYY
jgi:hypothetical protein